MSDFEIPSYAFDDQLGLIAEGKPFTRQESIQYIKAFKGFAPPFEQLTNTEHPNHAQACFQSGMNRMFENFKKYALLSYEPNGLNQINIDLLKLEFKSAYSEANNGYKLCRRRNRKKENITEGHYWFKGKNQISKHTGYIVRLFEGFYTSPLGYNSSRELINNNLVKIVYGVRFCLMSYLILLEKGYSKDNTDMLKKLLARYISAYAWYVSRNFLITNGTFVKLAQSYNAASYYSKNQKKGRLGLIGPETILELKKANYFAFYTKARCGFYRTIKIVEKEQHIRPYHKRHFKKISSDLYNIRRPENTKNQTLAKK